VQPGGVEPPTYRSVVCRSIQLSYGCTCRCRRRPPCGGGIVGQAALERNPLFGRKKTPPRPSPAAQERAPPPVPRSGRGGAWRGWGRGQPRWLDKTGRGQAGPERAPGDSWFQLSMNTRAGGAHVGAAAAHRFSADGPRSAAAETSCSCRANTGAGAGTPGSCRGNPCAAAEHRVSAPATPCSRGDPPFSAAAPIRSPVAPLRPAAETPCPG
jgi:hypothetical protein